MGMTCKVVRIPASEIPTVTASTPALRRLLDLDETNAPGVEIIRPKGCAGVLVRFLPIEISQVKPLPADAPPPIELEDRIELESWDHLHRFFTGSDKEGPLPQSFLTSGGINISDENNDSEDVHLLDPNEVRSVAAFLDTLTPTGLERRFPRRDPGFLEGLTVDFEALKQFFRGAADNSDAVVIAIS